MKRAEDRYQAGAEWIRTSEILSDSVAQQAVENAIRDGRPIPTDGKVQNGAYLRAFLRAEGTGET